MTPSAGLLEVGRIGRAHGIRGEVSISPITDIAARFAPESVLVVDDRALAIEKSRRQRDRWIVKFVGIDDRTSAERLSGALVFGRSGDPSPPDAYWVHELVGRGVRTTAGADVGVVASVQDNPAHDLLVLDTGALVPVVFVVEVDGEHVIVDPPDGLFDL